MKEEKLCFKEEVILDDYNKDIESKKVVKTHLSIFCWS